jgi:hypothetical protein
VYRDDGTFRWQIPTQDVQPTAKGSEQMRLATMKTIITKKKRPTLLLLLLLLWDPFLWSFLFSLNQNSGSCSLLKFNSLLLLVTETTPTKGLLFYS